MLLVDELDRADDEFEAFLLEVLSEFAVTIPEIGRVAAETPPAVVVTSNRTRELHDALKRRCLYHWIDHPDLDREIADRPCARAARERRAGARRRRSVVRALRELDLAKLPGVAETIDWANALAFLGAERLDAAIAADTLGAVVKDHEDQAARHRRVSPTSSAMADGTVASDGGRSRRSSRSAVSSATPGLPVGTGRILTFAARSRRWASPIASRSTGRGARR